jgi:hypothetical protein
LKRRLPDSGLRRYLTPTRVSASEFQRAARSMRATVDCIGGSTRTCSLSSNRFVPAATGTSAQGLTVTHVINTHGHPDHTNGNAKAAELTAAPVAAFADSSLVTPDLGLGDEQELEVGGLRFQFLHVPRHCPDHLGGLRTVGADPDHWRSAVRREGGWHVQR